MFVMMHINNSDEDTNIYNFEKKSRQKMPYHCNRSNHKQQNKVLFTFLQLKLYIYVCVCVFFFQCSHLYDSKCLKAD